MVSTFKVQYEDCVDNVRIKNMLPIIELFTQAGEEGMKGLSTLELNC